MAKRFTDNEKWKKQFFKSLSSVHKLFFLYILDECDHAGVWHVEKEIAEIRIGDKFNIDEAKKAFGKHIIEFDNGEKWFIPTFIEFQYGTLNDKVNAHKSALDKIISYGLLEKYEQFINSSSTVKDKDKDKDKYIDKDKDKEDKENQKNKFEMPTKNGIFEVTEKYFNELVLDYPNLDVKAEIKSMILWLNKEKSNLKTIRGMPMFINNWLKRSNDKIKKNSIKDDFYIPRENTPEEIKEIEKLAKLQWSNHATF